MIIINFVQLLKDLEIEIDKFNFNCWIISVLSVIVIDDLIWSQLLIYCIKL